MEAWLDGALFSTQQLEFIYLECCFLSSLAQPRHNPGEFQLNDQDDVLQCRNRAAEGHRKSRQEKLPEPLQEHHQLHRLQSLNGKKLQFLI